MAYELKDRQGNVVQRDGEVVFVADAEASIKAVNLDRRELTIIGSNETRDRDGDVIALKGWNFQNYAKNPVFLWAHNYSAVPIGATKRLTRKRDPAGLEFQIRFPTELGVYPFADMILQLYNDRIIKASSVGFIPKRWEALEKDGEEDSMVVRPGRRFVKQELLELSGCAVPSNPDAVTNMLKSYSRFDGLTQRAQDNIIHLLINGPTGTSEEKEIKEAVEQEVSKDMELIDELEGSKHFVPKEYEEEVPPKDPVPDDEEEEEEDHDETDEEAEEEGAGKYVQIDRYLVETKDDVLRPVYLSMNEGTGQVNVTDHICEEAEESSGADSRYWESMLENTNADFSSAECCDGKEEVRRETTQYPPKQEKSKSILTPEQGERILTTVESLRKRFSNVLGGNSK